MVNPTRIVFPLFFTHSYMKNITQDHWLLYTQRKNPTHTHGTQETFLSCGPQPEVI